MNEENIASDILTSEIDISDIYNPKKRALVNDSPQLKSYIQQVESIISEATNDIRYSPNNYSKDITGYRIEFNNHLLSFYRFLTTEILQDIISRTNKKYKKQTKINRKCEYVCK